jgi:hypothetical protein
MKGQEDDCAFAKSVTEDLDLPSSSSDPAADRPSSGQQTCHPKVGQHPTKPFQPPLFFSSADHPLEPESV